MNVELASKVSTNIFCYQLIGYCRNIIYNSHNRTILLIHADDGDILQTIEKDEDLDFDTFVLVAQNIFLDLVEYSN